ncbi:MAG: D-tyrosyl-tRNA(Tyr) deacylase [Eubacteriaceae bacterium]|nr:D-tyrosyl-tRNA(Tyr) deacylase [Eubacteriaceae bacterium]
MRAVVQRVTSCSVDCDNVTVSTIGRGVLVLIGIKEDDTIKDMEYIRDKVINLRIMDDEQGRMNDSVLEKNGEIMLVSQFTLYGDCRKGRRPSYIRAASPETAKSIYENVVKAFEESGLVIKQGVFQADMKVTLINDGPVTILLDSEKNI